MLLELSAVIIAGLAPVVAKILDTPAGVIFETLFEPLFEA